MLWGNLVNYHQTAANFESFLRANVQSSFKDQESANIVKTQLKYLSVKLQTIDQPVFTGHKIAQEFATSEPKPHLIDQQCVVYNFKCNQCDAGYVGHACGHLFVRVDGHRSQTSSVRNHYDNRHAGRIPGDLCNCFNVLKNARTCLIASLMRRYSLNNYNRV